MTQKKNGMKKSSRQTSKKVASLASSVLRSSKASKRSKSIAASALSQVAPKRKRK